MDPLSAAYLLVFVCWVPFLALRSLRALGQGHPLPSRSRLIAQTIILQFFFGGFSVVVAGEYQIPLFAPFTIPWTAVAAAAIIFAAMLGTVPYRWRAASAEQKRRLMHMRPQSLHDMCWWTVVCAAAAVSEEITYRGVLFAMLWYFTRSAWAAALISAAAFAAGHAVQGWRSALTIFAFAIAAQGLVWLSGSLYIAMLVHFLYDLAAGFVYLYLNCREPFSSAPPSSPPCP